MAGRRYSAEDMEALRRFAFGEDSRTNLAEWCKRNCRTRLTINSLLARLRGRPMTYEERKRWLAS